MSQPERHGRRSFAEGRSHVAMDKLPVLGPPPAHMTTTSSATVPEPEPPIAGAIPLLLVFLCLLGLTYSSTLFLPYALNDEQWIVRASDWWARFDVRQGRPLFTLAIYLTSQLHARIGFAVIAALRAGAIIGLAAAMILLSTWLQRWRFGRIPSAMMCLTIASLPPFQIYVVNATWLVMPLVASVAAMLLVAAGYRRSVTSRRSLLLYGAAAALMFASLAFYQPSVLIAPAMLIVPLMSVGVRDEEAEAHVIRFVIFAGVLIAGTVLTYYLCWLFLWRALEGASAGGYYSPTSFNMISLARLRYFFSDRLLQALNLWHVDSLQLTSFSYVTAALIAAGVVLDLIRTVAGRQTPAHLGRWCRKYAAVLAVLVASDGIPLLASSPIPSYVTAPALFFVVVFWAFASAREILTVRAMSNGPLFSCCLAIVMAAGLFLAQYTVSTYFSVPLFVEYRFVRGEIREYLNVHQSVRRIHVIGRHDSLLNHGLHEFAWSNATFDVYIRDMVKNALDDVGVPSEIDVTASGTLASSMPKADVPTSDALVIDLSRIHLR
jgi:hypothetical protein